MADEPAEDVDDLELAEEAVPGLPTARVEAFSDGVLAIAITLLVLELDVPAAGSNTSLWSALGEEWPSYAAYVVSFATIGIMWVNHHALFHVVGTVDRALLYRNLFLLGAVGVIPYTTALLAEHVQEGEGHAAAVVYAGSYALSGLGFCALWHHLRRTPELLRNGVPEEMAGNALRRAALGPVVYAIAAGLGLVSPYLTLATAFGLAVYFFGGHNPTAGRGGVR